MKRNRVMVVLLAGMLMASLAACGANDMASVIDETETVALTPEPANEIRSLPCVEENRLKYENETKVTTKGTLYVGNDVETLDVIDVNWKLTNVTVEDAEDGKTVTIEQSVEGYIWTDGNIFATNLNVPIARLADAYTGKMISTSEDAEATEIEWKDNTCTVSATQTTSWEDGDWDTEWVEDSNGGERLSSTLNVKTVVTIDKDYDGLVLVLVPITDANGSVDGEAIMDVWTDGSYLFNVNDMSANFTAEVVEETEAEVSEETEVAETTETPKETEAPKETTAPKEETKPTHTHSYNGVVTTNPTCTTNGVKTYTCSCGDSYTENLGTTAHDFSVPITQTVHHDEVWQTQERTVGTERVAICECGYEMRSEEEHQAHSIEDDCGRCWWIEDRPIKTYDYVKISDAYDEQVVVGYKCSICGQQK